MKISYNMIDADRIESAYFGQLPSDDGRIGRTARWAFRLALDLCGVRFSSFDGRRSHPLRVFAPDGGDWTDEQKRRYAARKAREYREFCRNVQRKGVTE